MGEKYRPKAALLNGDYIIYKNVDYEKIGTFKSWVLIEGDGEEFWLRQKDFELFFYKVSKEE